MGHNVIDFMDANIFEKLKKLEEEEEKLEACGFYDADPTTSSDAQRIQSVASEIRNIELLRRLEGREKKGNKIKMSRRSASAHDIDREMHRLGIDLDISNTKHIQESIQRVARKSEFRGRLVEADHDRSSSKPRRDRSGVRDEKMYNKVKKLNKNTQKRLFRDARKGEADRHIPDLKPKHLFSGKRGIGKTDRR